MFQTVSEILNLIEFPENSVSFIAKWKKKCVDKQS